MKKLINSLIIVFLFIFIPVFISAEDALPGSSVWYGFEDGRLWGVSDWQNNAMSKPAITGDFVSEGKKSMQVDLNITRAGQLGVVQAFDIGDMSGAEKINFDIYNSSDSAMKVFIMLKTGQNWVYHESKRLEIKPGWNKGLIFDLKAPEFGTGGKYDGVIKEPDQMRRFGLMFESAGPVRGMVFIDNIRLSGTGLNKLLPVQEKADDSEGTEVIIDGFEGGRLKWGAAGTWSCATSVENTTETASTGKGAMKAFYNLKEPGANAVFALEDSLDLSDAVEMKVDVYYPDDFPSSISLALGTGDKWEWQEYKSTKLRKGWNRDVTFSFVDKKWKNERSKWASTVNPDDINSVKRISLVFLPANIGEGHLIFDNIRIKTKNPGKLSGIMPFDMSTLTFYHWNSFEKGINWQTVSDQPGSVAVQPGFDVGKTGKKGMEAVFSTQSSVEKGSYVYRGREDFSKAAGMKFDIYNPMPYSVKISLAFQVNDEMTWIESKQIDISPGWNRDIFFNFLAPSFKSAESNWNYSEYFTHRDDIRTIFIQVFPDKKAEGSIFVTDMMLARRNFFGDTGKMLGFTLNNDSKVAFDSIKYLEWKNGEGAFENTAALAAWTANKATNEGVSRVSISEKYASKGSSSMRVDYKDSGSKFGIIYSGVQVAEIQSYTSVSFDLYNPGKRLKFTLAMKTNDDLWYETNKQLIINPGWNKNITIRFDEEVWKTGTMQGPMILGPKNNIKEMIFSFFEGYEGAVYIDNLRWGTKDLSRISDGAVEQDINIEFTPAELLEAKVTLRGSYYHGQNTELSVKSAHIIVRGFGNELGLSAGEPVKVFDDVFSLADPTAVGNNIMALTLGGTVYPINTSYLFSILSLDGIQPWKLGMSYIGTARLKTYFLGRNYAGAMLMHYRRGYDENANILTDEIQQSSNTFGLDTSFIVPVFDFIDINIKAEGLMSLYADYLPIFELKGGDFVYATQSLEEGKDNMLKYVEVSASKGPLNVYAYFRQIDNYFAGEYCNPDLRPGITNWDAKITYLLDDLPPFSMLKNISTDFAAFVRNTNLMIEGDLGISTSDDYARSTYTIDIKNDESLALYNYHIWYKYNYEGNTNTAMTSTNSVTGITKILLFDILTFKLLGRVAGTNGTVYVPEAGEYQVKSFVQLTGLIEASLKPIRDLTITGSYKGMSNPYAKHNNWYVKAEANIFGIAALGLSYGEPPLTGYWLEDYCNDTRQVYMATFNGRF